MGGRATTRWAIVAACLAGSIVGEARGQSAGRVTSSVDRVAADGSTRGFLVETFAPEMPGRYPIVVLLHGSGGLEGSTGPMFREAGGYLATRGYVAVIPHYFESTAHPIGQPVRDGDFEAWGGAIAAAIQLASTGPRGDGGRVGIVGYSMGWNLAKIRSMRDRKVRTLVAFSGAFPPVPLRKKAPPTLILHGSLDNSTPVSYVDRYRQELEKQAIPHAVHIYKGMGHNFDEDRFFDAVARAGKFFDQYLKAARPLTLDDTPEFPATPGARAAAAAGPPTSPDRSALDPLSDGPGSPSTRRPQP